MKSIQVFDPAQCCSTGVCGVDVEQALVSFASDVDWAKQNGAKIERFNLAQQPQAFADHSTVRVFLEKYGHNELPLILVDERQVLAGRYPSRNELADWIGANSETALAQDADVNAASPTSKACCEPKNKTTESAKSGCC